MVAETKVVLFGEGGVGKTSIALRFCKGIFLEKYDPTVEDCFRQHLSVNDNVYMLEIIDTAGTDQFAIMRELYIKSGQGFILVFSIVAEQTFIEIRNYYDQILSVKEDYKDYAFILVGNKSDLFQERVVPKDRAEALASEMNCPYLETSTKDNINVHKIFEDLVQLVYPQNVSPTKPKGKLCVLL